MRVTYDPQVRAAYLYLTDTSAPGEAARTLAVSDSINLDFDADGCLIGIELLDPALLHPTLMAQAETL